VSGHVVPVKTYIGIFLALMVLTALTTGAAFVDMGMWNTPVALAIAVTKMLLVVLFFMHAKYAHGLTQTVILAGFFFLSLLVAFTLADELSRHWGPQAHAWGALLLFTRGLF
jgi:cytochrome c oxidase subunit IV